MKPWKDALKEWTEDSNCRETQRVAGQRQGGRGQLRQAYSPCPPLKQTTNISPTTFLPVDKAASEATGYHTLLVILCQWDGLAVFFFCCLPQHAPASQIARTSLRSSCSSLSWRSCPSCQNTEPVTHGVSEAFALRSAPSPRWHQPPPWPCLPGTDMLA